MDHARAALKSLTAAEKTSGDHLTTAEAAHLNALQAIAHALLALLPMPGTDTPGTTPRRSRESPTRSPRLT